MCRVLFDVKQKDGFTINRTPLPPPLSISTPYNSLNYEKESTPPSSSFNKFSPVLLLVIVIFAVVFFVSGLLHLLVRFLLKRASFSPIYHSNRYPETSGSHSLQRQLQQLFRLHDSGLDQAFIDALPVFYYQDIMGLKEPFDCAVCLCEFSDQERLRLLPQCSHAFHINCIDTWLLSNSTCPLCRGTLLGSSLPMENPLSNYDLSRELSNGFSCEEECGSVNCQKPATIVEDKSDGEKRVFSVRLGKFRTLNDGEGIGEKQQGETSRCNLDARRCYSMGTVQYVEGESNLQVALSQGNLNCRGRDNGCPSTDGDLEDKKIRGRTRGDSFSVSKIWLWSKKSRFPTSSSIHVDMPSWSSVAVSLPINDTSTEIVRDT
ncbi:PREDICTED: RING-H2 finger protein ATL46-like [Populus euphratica]|uniref:RING-type E3 ubiquitin transferase n=1 Tax=Populus euphratica TaxID=75702 RepID=A0AAJ6Y6I7_POPEU|nr:PREDICTED: RING-H2 finger protein ATL46-like [Populus euphratica]XP_011044333.1 PREDICTED: RING-H2 finger protein ATL46-like [Populus euphratica]